MRTHDYLKARLLYVRQDFDEVLEKLTDADPPGALRTTCHR